MTNHRKYEIQYKSTSREQTASWSGHTSWFKILQLNYTDIVTTLNSWIDDHYWFAVSVGAVYVFCYVQYWFDACIFVYAYYIITFLKYMYPSFCHCCSPYPSICTQSAPDFRSNEISTFVSRNPIPESGIWKTLECNVVFKLPCVLEVRNGELFCRNVS